MPVPEKDDEVKSRREILAEAFDEAETRTGDDNAEGERGRVDAGKPDEGVQAPAKDDAGKRADGSGAPEGGGEEGKVDEAGKPVRGKGGKAETPDQKEARAAQAPDKGGGGADAGAPPGSWKPAAREEWGKIPANARAEIGRREMQIQRELSETANIRRFSNDLAVIINPHMDLIRGQNSNPLAAIDSLMKTASRLFRGNPQQKAQVIAEVMENYGVDVTVLDKVLSGKPLPEVMRGGAPADGGAPPAWAQPLFSFVNTVQEQRRAAEHEMNMQVEADIGTASNTLPFFNDLREDMADILESAAKRGKVVTMQQAYDRAVAMDPEISQIVAQRKTAEAQRNNGGGAPRQNNLQSRRRAASTISGAPRGAGSSSKDKLSRRETLEAAWDEKAG